MRDAGATLTVWTRHSCRSSCTSHAGLATRDSIGQERYKVTAGQAFRMRVHVSNDTGVRTDTTGPWGRSPNT